MYDELVNRLRTECTLPFQTLQLMREAADALDGFPAQVVIKGCRNCTFNIYPNQTKIVDFREDNDCPNCESDNRGDNDDT